MKQHALWGKWETLPSGKEPGPGSPRAAAQAVHHTVPGASLQTRLYESVKRQSSPGVLCSDWKVLHTAACLPLLPGRAECFGPAHWLLPVVSAGWGWAQLAGTECQGTLHKPQCDPPALLEHSASSREGAVGSEGSLRPRHTSLLLFQKAAAGLL